MLSQPSLIARNNSPTAILVLLTLALTTAFTIVCGGGGSLGEGGDPLSIVGAEAFELEIYSVDTYLAQDLPDELREDFTSLQQDFERFGIDFEGVDQFVKVVLDCCSYRKVGAANGPRAYVFDGSLDLGAVRAGSKRRAFSRACTATTRLGRSRSSQRSSEVSTTSELRFSRKRATWSWVP